MTDSLGVGDARGWVGGLVPEGYVTVFVSSFHSKIRPCSRNGRGVDGH